MRVRLAGKRRREELLVAVLDLVPQRPPEAPTILEVVSGRGDAAPRVVSRAANEQRRILQEKNPCCFPSEFRMRAAAPCAPVQRFCRTPLVP
jgi:hypothetical protein